MGLWERPWERKRGIIGGDLDAYSPQFIGFWQWAPVPELRYVNVLISSPTSRKCHLLLWHWAGAKFLTPQQQGSQAHIDVNNNRKHPGNVSFTSTFAPLCGSIDKKLIKISAVISCGCWPISGDARDLSLIELAWSRSLFLPRNRTIPVRRTDRVIIMPGKFK